jgi:hypothetical protein
MTSVIMTYLTIAAVLVLPTFPVLVPAIITAGGAVNLAGAQRDRGVQGLGGLGVGGMGQAAAVSPVTSLKTANRRVISVR